MPTSRNTRAHIPCPAEVVLAVVVISSDIVVVAIVVGLTVVVTVKKWLFCRLNMKINYRQSRRGPPPPSELPDGGGDRRAPSRVKGALKGPFGRERLYTLA